MISATYVEQTLDYAQETNSAKKEEKTQRILQKELTNHFKIN